MFLGIERPVHCSEMRTAKPCCQRQMYRTGVEVDNVEIASSLLERIQALQFTSLIVQPDCSRPRLFVPAPARVPESALANSVIA